MYNRAILNIKPLGFMWPTSDPFIFCVHHLDHYPSGNSDMGPAASLYFYKGKNLSVAGMYVESYQAIQMLSDQDVILESSGEDAFLLMLQGLPINEPVVRHGPFVMNSPDEIQQAIRDYRETGFGGWPWDRYDQVHPRDQGRFARYNNGKTETP